MWRAPLRAPNEEYRCPRPVTCTVSAHNARARREHPRCFARRALSAISRRAAAGGTPRAREAGRRNRQMSQRTVEAVIGRLVTDEAFRRRFRDRPATVVDELIASGTALTPVERQALLEMDSAACEEFADRVDPRLQKICLRKSQP